MISVLVTTLIRGFKNKTARVLTLNSAFERMQPILAIVSEQSPSLGLPPSRKPPYALQPGRRPRTWNGYEAWWAMDMERAKRNDLCGHGTFERTQPILAIVNERFPSLGLPPSRKLPYAFQPGRRPRTWNGYEARWATDVERVELNDLS